MNKNNKTAPMMIVIKEDLPIIRTVREVILRSAELGAKSISFVPQKKTHFIFCSDGKIIVPIGIHNLEKAGGTFFFAMIARIKVITSMNISNTQYTQSGLFETGKEGESEDKSFPAFTAVTVPTKYGEAMFITLSH